MLSSRLPSQLSCLSILLIINAAGCHTINGYTANSSGMSYYEQGNFAAAAGEFKQAMLSNPSNPDFIANYAKAKMKSGDPEGAEQLFRQAISISPSHQPAYHGLAESMIAQGRSEDAASLLTSWVATQPYVAESHVELAWLQREMGQPDLAAQSLQQALQVNPSHPTALAHLGQYYEETGHPDQAVAIYQRSLQSDWNQPEVHSRIAAASQTAGAASPMSATAMARGVHPYQVPRQQTAFGPPSRGAQMAQMQMAQTQIAMNGYPLTGPVDQTAAAPGQYTANMPMASTMNPGMFHGYYASGRPSPNMMMDPHGGWQAADAMMTIPPDQATSISFGTGSFEGNASAMPPVGSEWSFETESPSTTPPTMPLNSTPNTAVLPTPDPAFSATKPTTGIAKASWSPANPKSPVTEKASGELPLVEAF